MKLAIELPPAQAEKLRAEAQRLGLSPEDLARAAVSDLLSTPDEDFQNATRRVLSKNQELYKRLANVRLEPRATATSSHETLGATAPSRC